MYIDADTKEVGPSWENLLRKKYPNTSFARKLDDSYLSKMGVHAIKPAIRRVGVDYIERSPERIESVWTQVLEESKCR